MSSPRAAVVATVVTLALAVAIVVVVPLGMALLDAIPSRPLLAAGAMGGVLSLAVTPGPVAGGLAAAWLVAALALKGTSLLAWWRDPHLGWCVLARLAATGYLVGGAGWLVVSRLGLE